MGRKENKDYGKIIDYDPNWKGPLAIERESTDFGFLVSLGIYFIVWIAVGVYAFATGEIKEAAKNQTMTTQAKSNVTSNMNSSPDSPITSYVLGFIVLGIVLCLTFLYLLRHFPKAVVYTAIGVYCLILLLSIGFYALRLANRKKEDDDPTVPLVFAVIAFVVSIFILILVRKKIVIACGVVKESAKAVIFFPSSFLFPILPLILYGIVIIFSGATFVCLSSNPSVTGKNNNTAAHLYVFHGINIFGFLWLTNFVYAFSQMVLSGAFATWYWTMDKERVPSFAILKFIGVTTRFHLGTLAFGSLIIAIVQAIKLIAKALSKKERESGDNIGAILLSCLARICDAVEDILEYINHNAYIMCTIHGTRFIQSAKDAFNLLMRNAMSVVAVTHVTGAILLLGELVVIGLTLLVTYLTTRDLKGENACFEVMILVGVATLFICISIFEVLKTAINTIFLCVLEDYERNDGSSERPYFMSPKLRELLIQDA